MTPQNDALKPAFRLQRYWLGIGWLLVSVVIYASLTPAPITLDVEQGDKYSHILGYASLMCWFANLYENSVKRRALAATFILLGVMLEFLQGMTGYRTFDVYDMLANTTGVIVGWIAAAPRLPNFLRITEKLLVKPAT